MSNFKVDNLECNTINGSTTFGSGGNLPLHVEYFDSKNETSSK